MPTLYSEFPEHPLRDVPQEALDAATEALVEASETTEIWGEQHYVVDVELDDIDTVAHAVLAAALTKMKEA